jgi:hypothetical protein
MSKELSKTQIDRLGDRIKRGHITEEDLRLLDRYRRSFTPAYEVVVGAVRHKLSLEPTGRPAKSTISIIDKLKRESIRLTQIQDIAGCRIVIADIAEQESVIKSLTGLFPQAAVIDRRAKPSHGYRAVHVVVKQERKVIEIQVRTSFQHIWAEMSEKYSDHDPLIKYGGGNEGLKRYLQKLSDTIAEVEEGEKKTMNALAELPPDVQLPDDVRQELDARQDRLKQLREKGYEALRRITEESKQKEEGQ